MIHKYIIEDGFAVKCPNLSKWIKWYEYEARKYDKRDVVHGIRISTVFLGFDHNLDSRKSDPILWETMSFNDDEEKHIKLGDLTLTISPDLGQWRHKFMEEAYRFHAKKVKEYEKLYKNSIVEERR